MTSKRSSPTALLLAMVLAAMGPHPTHAAPPTAPNFEADIRPLFAAKCARCHGKDVHKGELALHTADAVRKGGESGPLVTPGNSSESPLFKMVHEGAMPPDKKNPFTPAEVELVRRWIDAGALFGDVAKNKPDLTHHDVVPILLLRCTVCHGGRKQEGGLDLRSRQSMLKGGKSGPAFVTGKPKESLILKRIHAEEMPPRKRLVEAMVKPMEADEVAKISRWIELGAPLAADEADVAGTESDPLVRPADKDFWSFRPPKFAPTPKVVHSDRIRNAIDAFVLSKLEQKGLSLAPDADRLTLLRRASFDLTGLPPEPAEVAAFQADSSVHAYENLIERLLASPRYGERWGRHWLDVAGYADCEGRREQHLPRPFAWRYRDYVIRSFNADKPYDQFLLEQIAGDELVDYQHAPQITQAIEDNLVATGFLRMAPDPTWANLTGFVPDRLDVIADSIDVLGSGVMGLTFKCARCHSHKFDPIPHRDYYRLAAVFKGAYDEHDWLKPQISNFGGAVSVGAGERFLPFVGSEERQKWQKSRDKLRQEIASLKAGPTSADATKRIKELEASLPAEPRIMALWDRGEPSPTYIYRRGDYQNNGAFVKPGAPAVLTYKGNAFEVLPSKPNGTSTGRRLALARWLVHPEQPLTARVMVNRIWKHHFGQGLVRSLGNFGKTGDRPTHPELLDWLACEFVRRGWSIKAMHRLMMTSSVYRQSSRTTEQEQRLDPDNRLLSRMPLRRMEAEELRDTLLLTAGQLDETPFGPADPVTVLPDGLVQSGNRRSVYVQQLRKHPATLLENFDLPAMNPNCLQRSDSLVALQALHLLNDAVVWSQAQKWAERIQKVAGDSPSSQVDRIYLTALSRPPSDEEKAASLSALSQMTAQWTKYLEAKGEPSRSEASKRALTGLCHTIMNSAMFLYID